MGKTQKGGPVGVKVANKRANKSKRKQNLLKRGVSTVDELVQRKKVRLEKKQQAAVKKKYEQNRMKTVGGKKNNIAPARSNKRVDSEDEAENPYDDLVGLDSVKEDQQYNYDTFLSNDLENTLQKAVGTRNLKKEQKEHRKQEKGSNQLQTKKSQHLEDGDSENDGHDASNNGDGIDEADMGGDVSGPSQSESEDDIAEYEKVPRAIREQNERGKGRLPVKVSGKLQQPERELVAQSGTREEKQNEEDSNFDSEEGSDEDEDGDEGEDENEDEDEDGDEDEQGNEDSELATKDIDPAHLAQQRVIRVNRLKAEIAELCEKLLEDPEQNTPNLHHLHQLVFDQDKSVQLLALTSEVEVYVDILPGYRIRVPTEDELQSKVSAEVKKLRTYEATLLNGYQRLLKHLIKLSFEYLRNKKRKQGPVSQEDKAIGLTIAQCVGRLFIRAYDFNFRKELINAAIPLLNHPSLEIRRVLMSATTQVFRKDVSGDSTLEAVRVINSTIKNHVRVRDHMLDCLLSVPLSKDIIRAEIQHKKKHKETQEEQEREEELQRDVEQSQAEISLEHKKKVQTQILTLVFTIYFRILKSNLRSPLLSSILRGLARFSHLINIELVLDLLEYLKVIIANDLPLESALNCIVATFDTLKSHGGAINVDLKAFYKQLYNMIWELIDPDHFKFIPLMLKCVGFMFQQKRELAIERVASFIKRLCLITLYVPTHAVVAILHTVRQLFDIYPKTKQLLDNESVASGVFLSDIDDPDHSNAFASPCWELVLTRRMYHPVVAPYLRSLFADEPQSAALAQVTSEQLFGLYDSSDGGFNPPLVAPGVVSKKKHSGQLKKRIAQFAQTESQIWPK